MADFGQALNKMLADAQQDVIGYVVDDELHRPEDVTVVRKISFPMFISTDLAMDLGMIPDTRPPYVPPPVPWRTRLRRRIAALRDWVALRLYRLIAGHDPEADCDC